MPLSGAAKNLQTNTGIVNISQSAAPSAGKVLTATSPTVASWQSVASGGTTPTATTIIPKFIGSSSITTSGILNSSILAYMGLIEVPFAITVNKVKVDIPSLTVVAGVKIGLYTADGQASVFTFATSIVAGGQSNTTNVNSILVAAGNYWEVLVPDGDGNPRFLSWFTPAAGVARITGSILTGGQTYGTISNTPGVMPTSFNVANVIAFPDCIPVIRLDN